MTQLTQCHSKLDWDDYILENGGHPLQLWGWGEVKSVHGWSAERLFLRDDNDDSIHCAAQVLIRRLPWPFKSLAYVPRGPLICREDDSEDMLQKLADYVKDKYHSVAISIEPDAVEFTIPLMWQRSDNHILPSKTILLDLDKNESELLNNMAKKTRQYIRKSASEAMEIKRVRDRVELDKCLAIYHQTARRAKFDLHDDQYYYDVFGNLDDNSQLFAAYVDDQPVAFLWLAISADTALELYGGMNEKGQELRLNYALKWHAIRKCKEWGLTRYDFGGLLEGGVTTFKMGWAESPTELAGTFDRPLSARYSAYSRGLPLAKKTVRRIKKPFKRR
ncbi:MAG TPA: peptidoglycan bridge formation glycyltransferase FemA/FemB family protein [Candidatus Saccharimonadales bacterium]|nr:peptidoglycan bridge formation glycyltransferase FemA/FemB family protein [Candidatus Saccharimonadales bacterium]